MSILERLINAGKYEEIVIKWSEIDTITLEDVAYASQNHNVVLEQAFFDNITNVIDEGDERNYLTIQTDDAYNSKNFNNIMLLRGSIHDYETYPIKIQKYNIEYDEFLEIKVDEWYLEEAWKYAVDNGLEYTKFGYAIISLGYKPPSSHKFNDWSSKIHPKPVKSARKIDN